MPVSNIESWSLGILAILVAACVILFHFLLFKTFLRQEKANLQRLKELQNLVSFQIQLSNSLASRSGNLQKDKVQIDEKLELIRLQVEAMSKNQGKGT